MMKALIQNELVINLSNTEYPPFEGMVWIDCPSDCQPGWVYINNQFIAPAQPKPTKKQELDNFNNCIQGFINTIAIKKGYIDGVSCLSYYTSNVKLWADDAKAFASWRDQIWQLTFVAIEPFDSGTGDLPDINIFIASLPQIVWPGV
jgi:hypothetical protein